MNASTALPLTGRPGVGKTTIIRIVAEDLPRERLAGFYTEEVREHGRRLGFRAVTFDGWRRVIADVGHPGPARVGRYGVDVAAIDALVERSLSASADDALFLIDEVGKMECHSASFVAAMAPAFELPDHAGRHGGRARRWLHRRSSRSSRCRALDSDTRES